jgi:hypothetical protein
MLARREVVSVRLDEKAAKRLAAAARLTGQSRGAFLGGAGDELARRVLLDWAKARHKDGDASFSELAERTGLSVEEIMASMPDNVEDGLALFLASARAVARATHDAEFLAAAENAARVVRDPARTTDAG